MDLHEIISEYIEREIWPWIDNGVLEDRGSDEEWDVAGTNGRWRVQVYQDRDDMKVELVEYADPAGEGNIWEEEYEMADLVKKMPSHGIRPASAPPQAPRTGPARQPRPDPTQQMQARLYDLNSKGGNMTPQEAQEYKGLLDQYKRLKGKAPGFIIARWVRRNCRFAKKCPCCNGWPCKCPPDCKCGCNKDKKK